MPDERNFEEVEKTPYEAGLESGQHGRWTDNHYTVGSTKWFEFEQGRSDGGAEDVGPGPGIAPWM